MKTMKMFRTIALGAVLLSAYGEAFTEETAEKSPADHLPPHIAQITHFGERADWSHDGNKILFLGKTFGDVFEYEVSTKIVRLISNHYPHEGYVRALYLANGDILLSGDPSFDAANPSPSRWNEAELWVLDKSLTKPPVRLGEKCSEGPAVSRHHLKIAWTVDHGDYPDRIAEGVSQIWTGDIEYKNGTPQLVNKKLALDSSTLDFKCNLECQSFRPPQEEEIIFSAYDYQGTEVMGIGLDDGKITNYSSAPNQYDEPEGMFPDGKSTLVECDRQNPKGSQYIDIWKLKLDGSHETERLTYFNDYPGFKASNPVVSDNGRFMAFQMAKVGDMAGVGRGLFIFDFSKMKP